MSIEPYHSLDAIVNTPSRPVSDMSVPSMDFVDAPMSNKLEELRVEATEVYPESEAETSGMEGMDRLTVPTTYTPSFPDGRDVCIDRPIRTGFPARPSSPTGSVFSSYSSRRQVTRHWSSHNRFHKSEHSKELTRQAESEFHALLDLMSNMSRRSSSLKEIWSKMISERESWALEMDEASERFEEYASSIERTRSKHQHQDRELADRQKEILKLRLDIKLAVESSSGLRQKLLDRDSELASARSSIQEYQDKHKYSQTEHEKTEVILSQTQSELVMWQEKCRVTKAESESQRDQLRSTRRTLQTVQDSYTALTSKHETIKQEVVSLKSSVTVLTSEKSRWIQERGELEDNVRKCRLREEEHKRRLIEITELYEKKKHEISILQQTITETQQTVSKLRYENEEYTLKISDLKRQLEETTSRCLDAEELCGKFRTKLEISERETISIREELRTSESKYSALSETLEKKTSEIRTLISEKESITEELRIKIKEAEDCHREISTLRESIRRYEHTIKEKSESIHSQSERIESIERERDGARDTCRDLRAELGIHQNSLAKLKLEIAIITGERDTAHKKISELEESYEEFRESFEEHRHGGHSSAEMLHLRDSVEEVRSQRDEAIKMRQAADRERDESISNYEKKCREVDRLQKLLESQSQSHSHGGVRSSSSSHSTTRRFGRRNSNGLSHVDEDPHIVY